MELRPWYRPAVQFIAHCLHTLNRSNEALELLEEANRKLESVGLLGQLASLQMDLELYPDAISTFERAGQFSPIAERSLDNWIAAQRCRAAGIIGDKTQAGQFAERLDDPYHRALAQRLKQVSSASRRVQLSVPFIQQFRMSCVPATLTMLCRYWQQPADHVEVAEAICYDGTPSHKARRWAEANGMVTREFTLNWDLAVALLERQIPFAVYTAEATTGHVQVLIGYDELRSSFIFRNPSFPQVQEMDAQQFLAHYSASGPTALVAIPAAREALLEGLTFPDRELFDRLRRLQQALEEHLRPAAQTELAEMQSLAPGHALTLTAARVLHSYDTNLPGLTDCITELLRLFPNDANLCLAKAAILRETAPREVRLQWLQEKCARKDADAAFHIQLGTELMSDARRLPEAWQALKKALHLQPLNANGIANLAQIYWTERRFEKALDLYRFSACLEATKEPPAWTYFLAANARRFTNPAFEFLQGRWENNQAKSAGPFVTWFNALQQTGRSHEALTRLDEALHAHPEHGELWLAAADAFARYGKLDRAAECLAAAEGRVQRAALLKVKADLAKYRAEPKTAIGLLREVLQNEPLSVSVHRVLVLLLAETEGREAALKYLEELCGRFTFHYQLNQLWAEWARAAGPDLGEKVARGLCQAHPSDAWARRQLALVLCDAARFDGALAQAEEAVRLAPEQATSLATRAHVRIHLGDIAAAREDFRQAIRLSVDFSPAIHGLVNSFETVAERREALAFVEQELVRQVVFGDGLRAYQEAARLNLEPASLLGSLRAALRARPDLAAAWSVTIQQLVQMLEFDEALSLALQAVERFPLLEQTWLDLALVQRLRLDPAGERASLEQGMLVNPGSSISIRMLAELSDREGNVQRAGELYEGACARAPLDVLNHGAWAAFLWRQGKESAALERLCHALKINPGYGWGWQTLNAWASAAGQPKVGENLARTLLEQRPGEVRCMLVLARSLGGTKRLEEALALVNETLKRFERNPEPHELRAELLAALGQHSEADAACAPAIFGAHPPAILRACRARLEAQRGNLVSAISRLKEVLQENPGYTQGWQMLADWLWRRKEHDGALEAITNVRRLDPLSPIPLGYRANMKLQKNDRAGAKSDLERALKYDPAYSFASLNLFDLQLAEGDVNGAKRTLALIQRHVGGERAKACEVKLQARFPRVVESPPDAADGKEPKVKQHDLEPAFARFKELCVSTKTDDESFGLAIQALFNAGQTRRVQDLLDEMMVQPDCNPAVGVWWMRRRVARQKWYCTGAVNRLCSRSAAARYAVITLIEALGEPKTSGGQGVNSANSFKTFRAVALWWLRRRHRDWLLQDVSGWGTMGFALLRLSRFRSAIRWMSDWRDRAGVKMWMLFNLSLALKSRHRWAEAREVMSAAVSLKERDHTFDGLRLLLAMELALAGQTQEAASHFHELNSQGWSKYMQNQYRLTQAVLTVQQTDPTLRKQTFRSERAAIDKSLGATVSNVRAERRRCLMRMAQDAGCPWPRFLLRFGF